MTWTLVWKLFRDVRVALMVVALLLGAFQCFWARITDRILGQLAPFFYTLASASGVLPSEVEATVFAGSGKVVRTLIGGERVQLDRAMDLMSIGYVHPLVQFILCIWAVGRASSAIAGELERGTLELLLAQPLARFKLILAHLGVDLLTIPLLALSMWVGTIAGVWLIGPIKIEKPDFLKNPPRQNYLVELGPLKIKLAGIQDRLRPDQPDMEEKVKQRLQIHSLAFLPALTVIGGLLFAVSGITLWLSAMGRNRSRVLGIAILLVLLMFLVNLLGQLWEPLEPLRPLTLFYYYQPQQVVLGNSPAMWNVTWSEWNQGQPMVELNMVVVLLGLGLGGYALATWCFLRRDLPAPL